MDSTKELIVRVLGREWPLTGKEIFNKVQKESDKSISYQGVQKQVKELVERTVLTKSIDGFQLNIEWLDLNKKTSEELLEKYGSFSKFKGDQFSVLLNSCYECDKFLLSMLIKSIPKNDSKTFIGLHWNHFWIPLFFSVKEYFMMKSFFSLYSKYAITPSNTVVDNWCAEYWKGHGLKTKLGVPLPLGRDLVICGDIIMEVIYPKKLVKKIDVFFKKVKNINELNINQLFEEIFLMPVKIPVIVTKNPELAEKLKKETMELFGEN
ncbi:MAG: hypothetical protein JW703_00835 [Candidatus Diapherotrites archaeon]|nr:hypothetical protein [Candidatus Diapherotrites archaeon]